MHDGPSFLLMLLLSLMSTVPAADRLQSTPPRRGEVTAICIGTATVLARSSQVAAAAGRAPRGDWLPLRDFFFKKNTIAEKLLGNVKYYNYYTVYRY